MLRTFCPHLFLESIYDLDRQHLKNLGVKGIIADFDNTLVPWDDRSLYPLLSTWLRELQDEGFKICIVSNSRSKRGKKIASSFDIPAIWSATKPRHRAFRRAMALLQLSPAETAVIGDQIFTDILGGNRMGLYTILVLPMSDHDFIGTRIVRWLELFILYRLRKKGYIL